MVHTSRCQPIHYLQTLCIGTDILRRLEPVQRISLIIREYGLKTPEFYQEEDFRVVIWRADNEESVPKRSNDDPKVFQSVPTDEEKLLEAIKETPSISRAELSKRLNISERQVRKIIDLLREKGVLIREGGNSGKWIVRNI